eukprot:m.141776 g.141776  ORF g.141776 m.141776 type:complete len:441 (-) comp16703_c0_seq2:167-1489(-)
MCMSHNNINNTQLKTRTHISHKQRPVATIAFSIRTCLSHSFNASSAPHTTLRAFHHSFHNSLHHFSRLERDDGVEVLLRDVVLHVGEADRLEHGCVLAGAALLALGLHQHVQRLQLGRERALGLDVGKQLLREEDSTARGQAGMQRAQQRDARLLVPVVQNAAEGKDVRLGRQLRIGRCVKEVKRHRVQARPHAVVAGRRKVLLRDRQHGRQVGHGCVHVRVGQAGLDGQVTRAAADVDQVAVGGQLREGADDGRGGAHAEAVHACHEGGGALARSIDGLEHVGGGAVEGLHPAVAALAHGVVKVAPHRVEQAGRVPHIAHRRGRAAAGQEGLGRPTVAVDPLRRRVGQELQADAGVQEALSRVLVALHLLSEDVEREPAAAVLQQVKHAEADGGKERLRLAERLDGVHHQGKVGGRVLRADDAAAGAGARIDTGAGHPC